MPPKKRGGRSVGSLKTTLSRPACNIKNSTPNTWSNLNFDILGETASGPNSTNNRKVTTIANNEMQIKLSNEVETDIVKEMQVADNLAKKPRMTRNCLKVNLKKDNASDNEKKTPSNVEPVRATLRQNKDNPAVRKRKLVRNNSIESDDLDVTTKRRCKNKRVLNKNNTKIRKDIKSKNTKKIKEKVINNKKSSAGGAQTLSDYQLSNSPHKVAEVRNKECFNLKVKISSEAAAETLPASSPSVCPSWTKDISSCSTVTCFTVRSGDIVPIDNKLPIVRLTDVCNRLALYDRDCKANGQSGKKGEQNIAKDLKKNSYYSLSTSTSSGSSSAGSDSCGGYQSGDDDIDKALEKLAIDFKNKDVEIIDWIACDDTNESSAPRNLRKRVCKALSEESEIIAHCRALKNILIDDYEDLITDSNQRKNDRQVERSVDREFIKSQDGTQVMAYDTANDPTSQGGDKERVSRPEETSGTCDFSLEEQANDDDDALSLFAESITGLESSRKTDSLPARGTSPVPYPGEYVPRQINDNKKSETVTYRPTQITKQSENCPRSQMVKIVCEKQNADSTSMYRVTANCSGDVSGAGPGRASAAPVAPHKPVPNRINQPVFIADIYPQPKKYRSFVFLGICFFHLTTKCKRDHCQFLHVEADAVTVVERLKRLNNDVLFIQEYMIMRNWVSLRRKYGLLFALEGIRRKLTGVVLEMAIDFMRNGNLNQHEDNSLTLKIVEVIMLYMNTINLREYSEYLTFPMTEGHMLCDIFMQLLANTQNFFRFKTIFINLTTFMDGIHRTFDFEVATLLLERVCILPHDEHSAGAMLLIMKRSSPDIMRNSRIDFFARRLSAHEYLYREFETLKRSAGERDEENAWPAPESPSSPPGRRRSFSPDTTGPDCGNILMAQAIDQHLEESFTKLGEERWPAVCAGATPRPPPRRSPPPPPPLMMATVCTARRMGALLDPLPRPLLPFPRNRPYKHRAATLQRVIARPPPSD